MVVASPVGRCDRHGGLVVMMMMDCQNVRLGNGYGTAGDSESVREEGSVDPEMHDYEFKARVL